MSSAAPERSAEADRRAAWGMLVPPLVLIALVGGGLLLAPFLTTTSLPLPGCGMKVVTGFPCPLCGGTHAWAALARGNVAAAFAYNPFGAALAFIVPLLALVWIACLRLGRWGQLRHARWIVSGALALLLLNWIYLIARAV